MPESVPVVNKQSFQVRSPLSGIVIIELDPVTRETRRQICPACVKYVEEHARHRPLDPVFFWGAGIYEYETHVTPMGTKVFTNREALGRFIRAMPYEMRKNWETLTGLPFPFRFVKVKAPK